MKLQKFIDLMMFFSLFYFNEIYNNYCLMKFLKQNFNEITK